MQTCYEEAKKEVTGFRHSANVWIETSERNPKSFVGLVTLVSDKIEMTPIRIAIEAYFVHAICLNVFA